MEEKSVEITNLDQQALNFQTSFVALVQLGLVVIYLMKEVHQAAALWWVHTGYGRNQKTPPAVNRVSLTLLVPVYSWEFLRKSKL